MSQGKLYLIPVPLAEEAEDLSYTLFTLKVINQIDEYIVENEKTARKFLKLAGLKTPQQQLKIHNYGKHVQAKIDLSRIFQEVKNGKDIGLMSEAGCPGVADPGAEIVNYAHLKQIEVVPLVGPSSILLALMGSGFNGQNFAFHGYLPIDKYERIRRLRELEAQSLRQDQTQIFIETPYRNSSLFDELLKACNAKTRLCIACHITARDGWVKTKTIAEWRTDKPNLHKKPAIFLIYN